MEKLDWLKIFSWHTFVLRTTGLWPKGDDLYTLNIYTIYMILVFILLEVCITCCQVINLYFIIDDLEAITGTIFLLVTEIGSCLKTYNLVKNIRKLKYLVNTLNRDLFQPKTGKQKELVLVNVNTWRMLVRIYWFFTVTCLIFLSLFPILDKSYKENRLPYLSWYPYSTNNSPQYELTYMYQAISVCFMAIINITIDITIGFINMYVESQFDILYDDLKNLHDHGNDVRLELKNCMFYYDEILNFADCANEFYNGLLFLQFFTSAVAIGMAMFQLTLVVPFSSQFYCLLTYVNAGLSQIFMYCWFGNEVEIKSSRLPYAVFQSDWVDFSPEVKKSMIIFVLRLQRSLQISAFGLFYLSLETFVKILRTAWSYFALLRQVNQPK